MTKLVSDFCLLLASSDVIYVSPVACCCRLVSAVVGTGRNLVGMVGIGRLGRQFLEIYYQDYTVIYLFFPGAI
jgi:hypothetical protein